MLFINNITDAAKQQMTLLGEAGEQIGFNLYFMPSQNGWFFDISDTGENFNCCGLRLSNSVNLLRQWKNNISFGLCVVSTDGFDPSNIEDFVNGRVQIYLLNAADVLTVEAALQK